MASEGPNRLTTVIGASGCGTPTPALLAVDDDRTSRKDKPVTTETARFRVEPSGQVDLTDLPTSVNPLYKSHKSYKKQLKKQVKKLSSLQRLHYASECATNEEAGGW